MKQDDRSIHVTEWWEIERRSNCNKPWEPVISHGTEQQALEWLNERKKTNKLIEGCTYQIKLVRTITETTIVKTHRVVKNKNSTEPYYENAFENTWINPGKCTTARSYTNKLIDIELDEFVLLNKALFRDSNINP